MNNEPVAWTDGKGNYFDKNSFFPVDDLIPLYTHPASLVDWSYQQGYQVGKETHSAKTLTDEEIWDFINALCLDMGDYWELTEKNAIPMIRAILRKAQEG